LGREEGDAEGIDVRGAIGAEPKTPKVSRVGEWGRAFCLPNQLQSLGERRELPSGVWDGAGPWPKTDFSAFQASQTA